MNLENYFYVFPEVVPSRLCDDLIHYGEQKTKKIALTGENAQQPKTDRDWET